MYTCLDVGRGWLLTFRYVCVHVCVCAYVLRTRAMVMATATARARARDHECDASHYMHVRDAYNECARRTCPARLLTWSHCSATHPAPPADCLSPLAPSARSQIRDQQTNDYYFTLSNMSSKRVFSCSCRSYTRVSRDMSISWNIPIKDLRDGGSTELCR